MNIWKEWAPNGRELTFEARAHILQRNHPEAYRKALPSPPPTAERPYGHPADPCGRLQVAFAACGVPTHEECDGDLGRIYGAQWRKWRYAAPYGRDPGGRAFTDNDGMCYAIEELDQISNLIRDLKENPNSRRHIVTAWNPGELDQMALPPCHCLFQFYTEELTLEERFKEYSEGWDREAAEAQWRLQFGPAYTDEKKHWLLDEHCIKRYRLSCQLYQRSCDIFLGVPFNIASYSLLTMMVAQCVNMVPGDFVHTYGDLHIYQNHMDQVNEQLSRKPRQLPRMRINPQVKDIFSFKVEDFTLEGYDPHPAIKAEVAV